MENSDHFSTPLLEESKFWSQNRRSSFLRRRGKSFNWRNFSPISRGTNEFDAGTKATQPFALPVIRSYLRHNCNEIAIGVGCQRGINAFLPSPHFFHPFSFLLPYTILDTDERIRYRLEYFIFESALLHRVQIKTRQMLMKASKSEIFQSKKKKIWRCSLNLLINEISIRIADMERSSHVVSRDRIKYVFIINSLPFYYYKHMYLR